MHLIIVDRIQSEVKSVHGSVRWLQLRREIMDGKLWNDGSGNNTCRNMHSLAG